MSFLPAPKHKYTVLEEETIVDNNVNLNITNNKNKNKNIPLLGQRNGYIPIKLTDYGDGGAFPEIHIVQYPLDMGRPGSNNSAIIAIDVDEKGEIKYDAIIKQGHNKNKLIQTSLNDIKEKEGNKNELMLPDDEEEMKTAEKTKLALEMLLNNKIKQSKPLTLANSRKESTNEEPTYIRYTPNPNAPGVNEENKQRIIRMVEAQVDPIEPPKHKTKKVPHGPPSPPAPVLHSPPRKLTVADQAVWKIPPCISNWKNARGYTIPLDKRLAADGRGLQETTINNKFASLSEALYVVERKAAEDLRIRNQVRKQMALKEKEDSEKELRELATKARMERTGIISEFDHDNNDNIYNNIPSSSSSSYNHNNNNNNNVSYYQNNNKNSNNKEPISYYQNTNTNTTININNNTMIETEDEKVARQQREALRIERRKEHEREIRLENVKGRRGDKLERDSGRDISEKIALGVLKGTAQLTGEAMFDNRLFNQSSGMNSGFGADDEYNTYTKSLFVRNEIGNSIYRPKSNDNEVYGDAEAQLAKLQANANKFKPDKGFKGAEDYASNGPRTAPVQFESVNNNNNNKIDKRSYNDDGDDHDTNYKKSKY